MNISENDFWKSVKGAFRKIARPPKKWGARTREGKYSNDVWVVRTLKLLSLPEEQGIVWLKEKRELVWCIEGLLLMKSTFNALRQTPRRIKRKLLVDEVIKEASSPQINVSFTIFRGMASAIQRKDRTAWEQMQVLKEYTDAWGEIRCIKISNKGEEPRKIERTLQEVVNPLLKDGEWVRAGEEISLLAMRIDILMREEGILLHAQAKEKIKKRRRK